MPGRQRPRDEVSLAGPKDAFSKKGGDVCLIEAFVSVTMTGGVKSLFRSWIGLRPVLLAMFVGEQQRLGQFTRMSVLLAAAVALSTAFNARPASGSCGDYVMVGGHGHADHDAPIDGVPACHGPNCHRQAPLPLAPTKVLIGGLPTDVACFYAIDGSSEPPLRGWLFESRISLADGHLLPPLRPPCL